MEQCDIDLASKKATIEELEKEANSKRAEIEHLRDSIIELEEEALLQDFGLYKPMYSFATSSEYKDRLEDCRNQQKDLIKSGMAATCTAEWTVSGSRTRGEKMTNDNIKQTVMMFNAECENAISKVSFSNYESMGKRIDRAYEKLNKLNKVLQIAISPAFLQLKHTELTLAYEYARKKQEEKEYIKEQREIEKENARVQKELEAERQRIAKEQAHYNNVLARLLEQLNVPGIEEEKRLVVSVQ